MDIGNVSITLLRSTCNCLYLSLFKIASYENDIGVEATPASKLSMNTCWITIAVQVE